MKYLGFHDFVSGLNVPVARHERIEVISVGVVDEEVSSIFTSVKQTCNIILVLHFCLVSMSPSLSFHLHVDSSWFVLTCVDCINSSSFVPVLTSVDHVDFC